MKLTTVEQATERLVESIDLTYYDSLDSQAKYGLGEPWNTNVRKGAQDSSFPYYEPPKLYTRKVGRSMKILANTLIELSSIMDQDPEPTWTQVPKPIAESRKQVFVSRWKKFGWKSVFERAYLDMSLLGLGIIEWGVDVDPESGKQYATCRHSPLIQTLKDAHESDPSKWRYIAFVKHMAPEDAIAMYGKKEEIEGALDQVDNDSFRKAVRIVDYWDKGYGTGDPTHIVFLNDVGGTVLVKPEKNIFGRKLPFSYGENVLMPGFKHHIGRIILQMAEQEQRNRLEKAAIKSAEDTGWDIVNTDKLDKAEFDKAKRDNRTNVYAKTGPTGDQQPPVERIPAREVSASLMNMMADIDKQLNAMSGTTDLEKGSLASQDRTLGEVQLVDQRSQAARGRMIRQTMHMYVRSVDAWESIAKVFDEMEASVDVFGANMTYNDPSDPRSSFALLFEEPSEVVISPASLTKHDEEMKKQLRVNQLMLLRGDPSVDQRKVTEELIKALGEDPAEYIVQAPAQPPMGQPMAPAMQGAPAQGM